MEKLKTAVLYDPYLDTLGGGERYTLTIAQILLDLGWQVDLAWHEQKTVTEAASRFGLNLTGLTVSAEYYRLFTTKSSLLDRRQALKNLDLVFIISDGSVPILFGKKTLLHYQVPFTKTNSPALLNSLKLLSINRIVVNSEFTKNIIKHTLRTNKITILYPPIDVASFTPAKKTKTILNVGRFTSPSHSKRQDVLITAFKSLVDDGLKGWELILAGGQSGSETQLNSLKKQATKYPIKFIVNPTFAKLQDLYGAASIYWHASGYEVDEKLNPEAVEHFGIATVEAMSAGCVPIVINKGGQKEIVDPDSGYLWDNLDELAILTNKVISDSKLRTKKAKAAQYRAQKFNLKHFRYTLNSLL